MKKKLQVIKFNINASGATEKINTQIDTHFNRIKGVFITCSATDVANGSTLQLDVDDEEIFPEDFEVSLINPTSANSYKDVSYSFDEEGLGNRVKGSYTDGGNGVAASYPYEVKIYLEAIEGKEDK